MLWTKRAHQSTNFKIFEYFNENLPNFSCQFWNHEVKVYSNFAALKVSFSVMKDNSSVLLYLFFFIFWIKKSCRREIFGLVSNWMKIHQILYVIFETTSQFFLNFVSLFSVSVMSTLMYFSAGTVRDFDKRSPSKCKILDFCLFT